MARGGQVLDLQKAEFGACGHRRSAIGRASLSCRLTRRVAPSGVVPARVRWVATAPAEPGIRADGEMRIMGQDGKGAVAHHWCCVAP
jgi:hypothetical protein